ncbi:MAG: acetylornithine deacetylase [Pseudomonadota bacterium]
MPADMSAREILHRLVAFPTVSHTSNLAIVDFIEDYLGSYSVPCHRDYDPTGDKANLFCHIGPEVDGGVVLSAHTDVVPVEGQDWVSDPWSVVERDGKLFGRGTTDMKGFIAIVLAAVPQMTDLKRPIQIALSYDEEIGLIGARPLVAAMADKLPKANAVLVGEPTGLRVVSGHKSCDAVEVHVTGHEVHSSIHDQGVSAVMTAARLIEWLRLRNADNRAAPVDPRNALFDPPYTTLHVGMINGGTAHNITAKDCRFSVDIRNVSTDMDGRHFEAFRDYCAVVNAEIKANHPDAGVECRVIAEGPGMAPTPNSPAEELARRITGDNAENAASYGTDGGWFQRGGYSTVVCGPGDIALAHQPNEYITVEQFEAGQAFLQKLITLCQE